MTTAPEDQLARAASLLREDLTTRAAYVSDASIYRRLPAAVAASLGIKVGASQMVAELAEAPFARTHQPRQVARPPRDV